VDGLLKQQLCEEELLVFAAKDVRREVQKEIKNLESGVRGNASHYLVSFQYSLFVLEDPSYGESGI
jgi:hypothetical protein